MTETKGWVNLDHTHPPPKAYVLPLNFNGRALAGLLLAHLVLESNANMFYRVGYVSFGEERFESLAETFEGAASLPCDRYEASSTQHVISIM